jgi:diguanylate cyclase (GGDEF)-like protein
VLGTHGSTTTPWARASAGGAHLASSARRVVQPDLTTADTDVVRRIPTSAVWGAATALAAVFYLVLSHDLVDAVPPVFGVACALGVLWRAVVLRREAAWWLAGAAMLQSAAGDVLWYLFEHVWHTDPFPSVADVFYLVSYPLLGAAFALLVRREIRGGDRASIIDASIVVAGVSALALVLIVEPYVRGGGSALEVGVAIAYPIGDLLILGFLARLLFAPTASPWVVRLLTLATIAMLASDIAFLRLDIQNRYTSGGPTDLGWIAWFGLTATAAWLPMAPPGDASKPSSRGMPPIRLGLLAAASLMAPAVLVIQGLRGRAVNGIGVGLVTGAAFILVLTRMAGLVRDVQANAATLTELSELDPLTGLANRRVWDRELPRAVDTAKRAGRVLAVAMLDLDLFKQLNDAKGHAAGDQVLRGAAANWSRHLRTGDLLARVGGEEFAVLLPGADESTAMEVVERIRAACPRPMTCSAGVAVLHPDESAKEVVERADAALYEAKERGRDLALLSARPTTAEPVRSALPTERTPRTRRATRNG